MSSSVDAKSAKRRASRRKLAASPVILWVTTPLLLLAFLGAWKAYTVLFDVGPLLLPPPETVAEAMGELLRGKVIYEAIQVTLYETLMGFALAAVVGVALGIVLGRARNLERVLHRSSSPPRWCRRWPSCR